MLYSSACMNFVYLSNNYYIKITYNKTIILDNGVYYRFLTAIASSI